MTISFTDDNGDRYDDVHLDQGPIKTGELFMVGGIVYEFTEAKSDPDISGQLKLKIRDVSSSEEISRNFEIGTGNLDINFDTFNGEAKSTSTTLNYLPTSAAGPAGLIPFKNVGNVPVRYDGSRLYIAKSGDIIGMDSGIVGALNNFQNENNPMNVSIIRENSTDINGDNDADDSLIVVKIDLLRITISH